LLLNKTCKILGLANIEAFNTPIVESLRLWHDFRFALSIWLITASLQNVFNPLLTADGLLAVYACFLFGINDVLTFYNSTLYFLVFS